MLEILSNLEDHRNNNFTGKMLLHHSLQSSKYMSKWIQEKNNNLDDNVVLAIFNKSV